MSDRPTRILLVEDEGLVALDLEQSLSKLGYEVVGAADTSTAAVALARVHTPDIVLMDIRIRGEVDGIEAAREIWLRFGIPTVFVTGNADQATLDRATQSEPFGFVLKPIDFRELQAVILTGLRRCQAERRTRRLETYLLGALRALEEAVVLIDLQGQVVFLNRAAERLLERATHQSVGQPFSEVVTLVESGTPRTEQLRLVLDTGVSVPLPKGTLLVRRDKSLVLVDGSISPMVDEGKLLGALVLLRHQAPPPV